MPHFGLMNADALGPERAALMRARLHIRGGKRRIRQGKISAGIVTLYDALDHAMEWYLLAGEKRGEITAAVPDKPDSRTVMQALAGAGIIDGGFDYDGFNALAERALHDDLPDFDCEGLVAGIEGVMTALGIMPFSEEELPPEDPATF